MTARILLVEDDRHVRPPLEILLALEPGCEVSVVETLAKAMALLTWKSFDLVVTDVSLPDGSGLAIADKAREIGTKVLVVTGYALALKPGSLDGYDYLVKPVRAEELLAKVRQSLPRHNPVLPFPQKRVKGSAE